MARTPASQASAGEDDDVAIRLRPLGRRLHALELGVGGLPLGDGLGPCLDEGGAPPEEELDFDRRSPSLLSGMDEGSNLRLFECSCIVLLSCLGRSEGIIGTWARMVACTSLQRLMARGMPGLVESKLHGVV